MKRIVLTFSTWWTIRVRKFCDGYAYQNSEFRDRMAGHLILAGIPA